MKATLKNWAGMLAQLPLMRIMSGSHTSLSEYLGPTRFLDSDHPDVLGLARDATASAATAKGMATALYYAVRDGIRYDPYRIDLAPDSMRASAVLQRGFGFCVPKAVLLAAAARAVGIPARLGFADVRNHLATDRLLRLMGTDVFTYHGYAELHVDDTWVKATPAFNASLCERFDVAPLEFDGRSDSVFQEFDRRGNKYMEYLRDHGHYADLPLDQMVTAFRTHYPELMTGKGYHLPGRFEEEAPN